MIPGLVLHQEQREITCDADAESSRNERGARWLSRRFSRRKSDATSLRSRRRCGPRIPFETRRITWRGSRHGRGAEVFEQEARSPSSDPKAKISQISSRAGRARSAEGELRGAGGRRGKARSPRTARRGDVCKSAEVRGDSERVPTGLAGASRCKATGLEWLPSERPILGLRGESNPSGKNTLRETERRRCAAILDT